MCLEGHQQEYCNLIGPQLQSHDKSYMLKLGTFLLLPEDKEGKVSAMPDYTAVD